jgi:hypothetical protein
MTLFRGSDASLDREILALEGIAKVRVRRAAADLRELERDLSELRRERARRRAAGELPTAEGAPTGAEVF